ncbi:cadherin-like domain-containing protein, partial [Devosia sp. WQ 349]|uniref:Ig-like domain-containing protein n=1 Tax=Devosia sp. WQ 349K1 TaxID=2800329 RepID=UPI0019079CF7
MVVSVKSPIFGSQEDIISSAEVMRVAQSTAVTASPTSIAQDTASSTGSAQQAAQQLVIEVEDGSVLRLPEGVSLEQPRANGADLEFVQPDGTTIVVPNGAITGLSIVLGEVEIPEFAVAALFEANGIATAAGPGGSNSRSSSGGNFEQPVGGIGPAFDIGDLLPPTALSFNSPEDREYFFGELLDRADEGVTINGLNVTGGELKVDEDDLPDGTSPNGLALTQTGIFTFSAKDGFGSLSIGGIDVRLGATLPQTIVDNATGTLVVTGFSFDTVTGVGAVDYRYTLKDNTLLHTTGNGENTLTLPFPVIVKDGDGSQANASLDVTIVDDVPDAKDDSAAPAEDQPIVIKVLDDDDKGADGVDLVTGVELETGPSKGSAVYNDNGTFTYTPTAGKTGTDSFTYTITDKDGDSSTATVTITLAADSAPKITVNHPVAVVDEDGLSGANVDGTPLVSGEVDSTENASYTGTITVNYGNDVPADLLGAI